MAEKKKLNVCNIQLQLVTWTILSLPKILYLSKISNSVDLIQEI